MEKYEKCKNCGEDIFFQKRWNKWYHNNGKKNCSKQYPQVQINGLILTPVAQPKDHEEIIKKNEQVLEISKIVQKFRKADEKVLKEEPCCRINVKGEKYYCQFHSLLNELDIWIEKD